VDDVLLVNIGDGLEHLTSERSGHFFCECAFVHFVKELATCVGTLSEQRDDRTQADLHT
jgi:hypothetical protein